MDEKLMVKIINKLGIFYIKCKDVKDLNSFKKQDYLKCYNHDNMECTIFNKDIINNSTFIRIN